ncbi:hypothetical protein LXA43DRAFT_244143 [Ganoderma leucocontextum]|nr:hypothetical protein LXA43DRAFT_244143 [Ganoderma leucocontextum]
MRLACLDGLCATFRFPRGRPVPRRPSRQQTSSRCHCEPYTTCAASRRVDCDDRVLLVPSPPSQMPTANPFICRTLLSDGQTRCSAFVKPGRQSCLKHTSAYDASYERYKHAENAAKDLRAAAQTKRGDVHTLPSEEIEPRIKSVRAYIEALELESRLRREHDGRFIGDPDEGHRKRLDALEKQLTHHRDIVEALCARLQRLKPDGQSSPPKHRRRHRHTLSDPTPQPTPPVTRASRRRSHGQQKHKGAHRKSRSDQSGFKEWKDEHLIVSVDQGNGEVEEENAFHYLVEPSGPLLRESEGACVGGALGRGLEVEGSVGGSGGQVEDEHRLEESTAVAAAGCEGSAIGPVDAATIHRIVDPTNTSLPPPWPIEPAGPRKKPANDEGASRQLAEDDDTLAGSTVSPSPLPQIVGEYPEVDSENQETGGGGNPGTSRHGRYLQYALTAILPVTVVALNRTFATIRDSASKICHPRR